MWRNHPFSQRNKGTKKGEGIGVFVDMCVCGKGEGGDRQYRGGLHKIGG